jgi:hypothetical protein
VLLLLAPVIIISSMKHARRTQLPPCLESRASRRPEFGTTGGLHAPAQAPPQTTRCTTLMCVPAGLPSLLQSRGRSGRQQFAQQFAHQRYSKALQRVLDEWCWMVSVVGGGRGEGALPRASGTESPLHLQTQQVAPMHEGRHHSHRSPPSRAREFMQCRL